MPPMSQLGHEPSFGQAAQFLLSPRADTRCAGLHHPLHRAGLRDAPARQSSSPGRMPTGRNRSRSTRSAGVTYSRPSVHLNRAAAGPAILNNPARGAGHLARSSGRLPGAFHIVSLCEQPALPDQLTIPHTNRLDQVARQALDVAARLEADRLPGRTPRLKFADFAGCRFESCSGQDRICT